MKNNRFVVFAGSIRLGVVLILIVCVYMSLATIPPCAAKLASILGTSASDLYSHWTMIFLCMAICLNTVIGTITRIALKPRNLGAYTAHLGLILLAVGSVQFTTARKEGYAATSLRRDMTWTDIDEYYIRGTNILTVRFRGEQKYKTVLPPSEDSVETESDISIRPVPSASDIKTPADVKISLTGWSAAITPVDIMDIRVETGVIPKMYTLVGVPEDGSQINLGNFDLEYKPNPSMAEAQNLLFPPENKEITTVRPRVVLMTGDTLRPQIVLVMKDNTRRTAPLVMNKRVIIPFGDERGTAITPVRQYMKAADRPVDSKKYPRATAGQLEITFGDWQIETLLLKHRVPGMPMSIPTPDGRFLQLEILPESRPLDATIEIDRVEYVPYIGSMMPKDYVTEVTVKKDGEKEEGTIRLNQPVMAGPFQLSQNTWGPRPSNPQWIILGVATRPGIWSVWLGFFLLCISMPVAFYIKPILIRRSRQKDDGNGGQS